MMKRDFDPARELERARSALWHLDAGCSRPEWVRLAMAAKAAGLTFEDFHGWSATASNYRSEQDCRAVWKSIDGDGIGAATLFGAAHATGWQDPTHSDTTSQRPGLLPWRTRVSDGSLDDQQIEDRTEGTRTAQAPQSERGQGERTSAAWLARLEAFAQAPADHPYLVRKGLAPDGLRVAPKGIRIAGHDCAGWLAVPVWSIETGEPQSAQFVSPEAGKPKLSAPGCRIAGGAFVVHQDAPEGRPLPETFAEGVAHLAEGLATAGTIYRATGRAAVCCFGKSNFDGAARALRARYPRLDLVLWPDRGAEHQTAEIARSIGGMAGWVELPDTLGSNGDANDLEAAEGLDAVRALLDTVKRPPLPFRFLSAAELVALPSVPMLVRGVAPLAGIGALYGASAAGKSFIALHLLAHVAGGAPDWFGHRINRPASVVYVGLEGEAGLSGRAKAWQARHGALPARLHFLIRQPFALLSDQNVRDLGETVLAVAGPCALVCIDTLNAATPGADENSSADMGRMIDAAKRLQAQTAGLVLLVHHTGKDQTRGMRGHSSLFAACDFAIEVTRNEDRREWRIAKSKHGADDVAHPFRLDVVEIGADPDDGEPITSCVVAPEERAADVVRRVNLPTGGNQRIIFDALRDLLRESKKFGMAGAPPTRPCIALEDAIEKTRDRLACESDRKTERTRAALTGLVNRGALVLREGWLWLA